MFMARRAARIGVLRSWKLGIGCVGVGGVVVKNCVTGFAANMWRMGSSG